MFVSVVSLSQPSSREWHLLYVNVCVCVLSRYLSPVVENGICYMLNVMCAVSLSQPSSREWYLLYVKCLCLLSRYLSPVVENGICYMLNVCVCCLVISSQ